MKMDNKVQKKVLVTGAAGFIGSHLSRRLVGDGYSVVGVDNLNLYYSPKQKLLNIEDLFPADNFYFVLGDVTRKGFLDSLFKRYRFDYVVHLAARAGVRPSIEKPLWYKEANISGTVNLLELAKQYHIKNFVFASSSSVYGEREELPFSEDQSVDFPVSPYAASKKSGELFAYTYSYLTGLPVTCLRFFTVYGPGNRPDMAMYLFVDGIFKDKPIIKYGDGRTKRSYTYIDDIVNGIILALNKPQSYTIINLGGSQTVELNELIDTLEDVCGKKVNIKQLSRPAGDVAITYADNKKAEVELEWKPRVSFRDGCTKLVEWYREHGKNKDKKINLAGITKKVLVFTLNYEPYMSGAEMAIKEVSKRIDHYNFDIITLRHNDDQPAKEEQGHITIHRVSSGSSLGKLLFPWLALVRALKLKSNNYDIVWGMMASYAGLAAMLFHKMTKGNKFLLSLQRGESESYILKKTWFWYPIYRMIFSSADQIQATAPWHIRRAKAKGYRGEVKIIPNGVGISNWQAVYSEEEKNKLKTDVGWGKTDRILITSAGPIDFYGADDAISALKYLDDNFKLLIINSGVDEQKLYSLASQLELADRVKFISHEDANQLAAYLKMSDVFIRPLKNRGLAGFILEAMLCKVPVVASDVQGINDLVIHKNTGLLSQASNPQSIASQIKEILSNSDLRDSLVINAFSIVSREYDWEMAAEGMKEVFENM